MHFKLQINSRQINSRQKRADKLGVDKKIALTELTANAT